MPDWKSEVERAIGRLDLGLAREQAIVDELADYLGARYDDLIARGASETEAHAAVRAELSEERLRAELRPIFARAAEPMAPGSAPPQGFWTGTARDFLLAIRQLRLNPGFALVAILSLALGVGANTTIFELIDAVVLRTLPVQNPQQLADVHLIHGGRVGSTVARQKDISSAIWDQFRPQQQAFSDVAAWSTERFDLGHGGEARYADGMWVSGGFFHVLQVQPMLGRLIMPSDDLKGCGLQGAVISYSFWQSEFGGRANAIGSSISLDRHPFQIIGITPPAFTGLEVGRKFDVALPLCSEPALHGADGWTKSQTTWWLAVIGRLKPEWSFDRASAQFTSISSGIIAATLPSNYDAIERKDYLRFGFRAEPAATGDSPLRKEFEAPLCVLLAISGLVLLIACANIANLMLARASARQHEMALRMALGASRSRVARQLLVESLLLAVAGTAAGALLAQLIGRALIAGIGNSQDRVFLSLAPDWRMLAFTVSVALLTCLVFGVAPSMHAARAEPGSVMKAGGRGMSEGRQRLMLRRGFIVAQVALSLVLVVTALLFVRTFRNLVNLYVGFDQQNILVADFDASALNLPVERRMSFNQELIRQVRALPGVAAAATTAIVPLSGDGWNEFIDIPGTAVQRKLVDFTQVSSGYFNTLHVPLLAGRDFDANDSVNAPPSAIVNEAFARQLLGAGAVLGKTFGTRQAGGKPEKIFRIVGLAGNTKYLDVREEFVPIAYTAESQDPSPGLESMLLIRSSEDPRALIPSLKDLAAKDSPEIVLNFTLMRTSIIDRLGRERLMASLSGFYGGLAALLAAVGLYGIMSYSVARRKIEIGIRMALGASRRRILAMVLREALGMLWIGLLIGIILVVAVGRAAQSMLFGLRSTDPLTLALSAAGMIALTLIATLVPARRAAATQPMQTLREE
jgi:putative ABC transport system permease protein